MDDIFNTKNLYLASLSKIKQVENGKISWRIDDDEYERYTIAYLDSPTNTRARDAFTATLYIIAKRVNYEDLYNNLGVSCVINLEPISLFMRQPSEEVSSNELISILNRFDELRKNMFGVNDVILRLIAELNSTVDILEYIDEEDKEIIKNNLYKIASCYVQDLVDYNSGKLISGNIESIRELYLKEVLKVQSTMDEYIPREQSKLEDEFDNLKLLMNKD